MICDEGKFWSIIISSKCKFNKQVLKDYISGKKDYIILNKEISICIALLFLNETFLV
jgi:hypothetical protein